jgi:flagellar basal body-associated protein FliL
MSFRTRLTLFFVLIVVVPMIALGIAVARIVSDSQHAKAVAQNRASAAAALADFEHLADEGARHARALARDATLAAALATPGTVDDRAVAQTLEDQRGLARVRIVQAGRTLADVGDPHAIARGVVRVRRAAQAPSAEPPIAIEAATLTADRFARTASVGGVRAIVERDGAVLASTLPVRARPRQARLPDHGTVSLGGVEYTVATFSGRDFGGRSTTVVVLTDTSAAATAAARGQWIAIVLLALFLLLAFAGAMAVSGRMSH